MKATIRGILRRLGYDLVRHPPPPADPAAGLGDLSATDIEIVRRVAPFTMTSGARLASLIQAVHYVSAHHIPGEIVECGVWRGGSMMAIALSLLARGDTSRSLYLYDTYEGMPSPTSADVSFGGQKAHQLLAQDAPGTGIWCYASLDDVKTNLMGTGYPESRINFVKGRVETTIPSTSPATIALLRLDTDWYESTRHELQHLYPRLSKHGALIIDDYGHWQGAKRAVDEFFREDPSVFLHRIDYTGRLLVKTTDVPPT
jgi:hypothetical protein